MRARKRVRWLRRTIVAGSLVGFVVGELLLEGGDGCLGIVSAVAVNTFNFVCVVQLVVMSSRAQNQHRRSVDLVNPDHTLQSQNNSPDRPNPPSPNHGLPAILYKIMHADQPRPPP